MESDTNSDSEDGDLVRNLNEADDLNVDSLHLSEQVVYPLAFVVIQDILAMGNGVCYLFICFILMTLVRRSEVQVKKYKTIVAQQDNTITNRLIC